MITKSNHKQQYYAIKKRVIFYTVSFFSASPTFFSSEETPLGSAFCAEGSLSCVTITVKFPC